MIDPCIFNHPIDDAKKAQIRKASNKETGESLCVWLDGWTECSFIDSEYIMYAGLEVGCAGKTGLDKVVLKWLIKDFSIKRLNIAANFWEGYWLSNAK